MVELHRDGVAEISLLIRCTAEIAHATHFFEVANGYALGRNPE